MPSANPDTDDPTVAGPGPWAAICPQCSTDRDTTTGIRCTCTRFHCPTCGLTLDSDEYAEQITRFDEWRTNIELMERELCSVTT